MGKNTLAQVAFGRSVEDEFQDNLRNISGHLKDNAAIFFTNRDREEVEKFFREYAVPDFAQGGDVAKEDISLEEGHVFTGPTSMVDQLRTLGAVCDVDNGKIVLQSEYQAAEKGKRLSPEQAKMLVHLGKKLAMFTLTPEAFWSDGAYEEL